LLLGSLASTSAGPLDILTPVIQLVSGLPGDVIQLISNLLTIVLGLVTSLLNLLNQLITTLIIRLIIIPTLNVLLGQLENKLPITLKEYKNAALELETVQLYSSIKRLSAILLNDPNSVGNLQDILTIVDRLEQRTTVWLKDFETYSIKKSTDVCSASSIQVKNNDCISTPQTDKFLELFTTKWYTAGKKILITLIRMCWFIIMSSL